MNEFQRKLFKAITEARASAAKSSLSFSLVRGKKQDYFVAKVAGSGQSFDVYVYEDEAGCMKNGTEWTIFERPDFSDEDQLIDRFVTHLKSVLP
jgi:hypothetical protein